MSNKHACLIKATIISLFLRNSHLSQGLTTGNISKQIHVLLGPVELAQLKRYKSMSIVCNLNEPPFLPRYVFKNPYILGNSFLYHAGILLGVCGFCHVLFDWFNKTTDFTKTKTPTCLPSHPVLLLFFCCC